MSCDGTRCIHIVSRLTGIPAGIISRFVDTSRRWPAITQRPIHDVILQAATRGNARNGHGASMTTYHAVVQGMAAMFRATINDYRHRVERARIRCAAIIEALLAPVSEQHALLQLPPLHPETITSLRTIIVHQLEQDRVESPQSVSVERADPIASAIAIRRGAPVQEDLWPVMERHPEAAQHLLIAGFTTDTLLASAATLPRSAAIVLSRRPDLMTSNLIRAAARTALSAVTVLEERPDLRTQQMLWNAARRTPSTALRALAVDAQRIHDSRFLSAIARDSRVALEAVYAFPSIRHAPAIIAALARHPDFAYRVARDFPDLAHALPIVEAIRSDAWTSLLFTAASQRRTLPPDASPAADTEHS